MHEKPRGTGNDFEDPDGWHGANLSSTRYCLTQTVTGRWLGLPSSTLAAPIPLPEDGLECLFRFFHGESSLSPPQRRWGCAGRAGWRGSARAGGGPWPGGAGAGRHARPAPGPKTAAGQIRPLGRDHKSVTLLSLAYVTGGRWHVVVYLPPSLNSLRNYFLARVLAATRRGGAQFDARQIVILSCGWFFIDLPSLRLSVRQAERVPEVNTHNRVFRC